jgi:hypothetical protein
MRLEGSESCQRIAPPEIGGNRLSGLRRKIRSIRSPLKAT